MQHYIKRKLYNQIKENLKDFPVVAILGPRQCGKSTLAKRLSLEFDNVLYLDLEKPSDLIRKLKEPELFFQLHKDKLIFLDEIQRAPDLFPVLRCIVDENERNGQFIILGSASADLLKQSSETLAGRIAYMELTPFTYLELAKDKKDNQELLTSHLVKGGFPRSFLARSDESSFNWRKNFIRTFLEKDIPQLGFSIATSNTFNRLLSMCAHSHGQIFNSSKIGSSLGISHTTIRNYVELLKQTFMLKLLPPFFPNIKKRFIKSPKIFIRDSGILHALLEIENYNDLLGHPMFGSSWEGFIIENIMSTFPNWNFSFYRTATGVELDLIMTKGEKKIAVECKSSVTPTITKNFWSALEDLEIDEAFVIAPIQDDFPINKNVMATSLHNFIKNFSRF